MKITTFLTQLALATIALFFFGLVANFNAVEFFFAALAVQFILLSVQDYSIPRPLRPVVVRFDRLVVARSLRDEAIHGLARGCA